MLVNLIAELNALGIFHILLLGFNGETCKKLARRRRIGCAHSSYLWDTHAAGEAGELARHRHGWDLAPRYVAWIQKFHYMRLLIERRVNVLALDSDVVVTANPYPFLHGPFGRYAMVTAFDTKGGFANINVGIVYTQNASIGGAVHGLFVEFERRVALGLRIQPPRNDRRRESLAVRFFWDQNLFNKVLLSRLIDRDVYLPDGSDEEWTRSHMDALRLVGRPGPIEHGPGGVVWQTADRPVHAPRRLTSRKPWYPSPAEYKWARLPTPYRALASREGAFGAGRAGRTDAERLLLAPPWLISADNALGHRYKHWLYGTTPAPCVMLHFVCVAAGERSRILPMQLFGRWHHRAVDAETGALGLERATAVNATEASVAPQLTRAPPTPPRRILALAGATIESAMAPRPWAELNVLQALLGGLAVLSGRSLVLPAINCTRTVETGIDFLIPGRLPNRCFWHVHSKAGVACVFRLGSCGENFDLGVVSPSELEADLRRLRPGRVPTVTLDLSTPVGAADTHTGKGLEDLLQRHRDAEVVLVRLSAPTERDGKGVHHAAKVARALDTSLGQAVHSFARQCSELVDRSKRQKRECTNVC